MQFSLLLLTDKLHGAAQGDVDVGGEQSGDDLAIGTEAARDDANLLLFKKSHVLLHHMVEHGLPVSPRVEAQIMPSNVPESLE